MPINRGDAGMSAVHQTIKDVFAEFGVAAERADDIEHDGVVTDMILGKIRNCEFLVADLTAERPASTMRLDMPMRWTSE